MPYVTSTLNHASQYTLQATTTGSCACTILTIKSTGAMSAEITTDPNGARAIPNGAARMIFLAHAQLGTTGTFQLTQSGQILASIAIGGAAPLEVEVTIDVV